MRLVSYSKIKDPKLETSQVSFQKTKAGVE